MKLCCISNREAVFLFLDSQILDTLFLEDINALLHTGEIPNLFRHEDIQEVDRYIFLLFENQYLIYRFAINLPRQLPDKVYQIQI
jgi:hypothetical protein